MPNLNAAPSLDLTDFLNLFNCTFVNLQFILVYSTIYKCRRHKCFALMFHELNFSFILFNTL